MGGSVVKMNLFVPGQPPILFRLMGVQIIENDMAAGPNRLPPPHS